VLNPIKANQIKSQIVLSSVIKKAVQLKGNGPKFLGLCPFHEEKTPSFNVNDKLGRFKCFGCGASGDVFEFIMRLRGLSFREAVEDASRSAGLNFSVSGGLKAKPRSANDDVVRELLRAQKVAHEYFMAQIKLGLKNPGREYLSLRNINMAMVEQAALGFGGLSGSEFFAHLKQHDISQSLATQAGLLKYQGTALIPMFLGRLVFPIRRFDGKVVAFGGRSFLEQDQEAPKYVNTHAYMLYEKRTNFYGLFESKAAILKGQVPVLVEGYFDAMALWAIGVPALALCGTALSPQHSGILKRLVSRLIICFDKDAAGFRALRASLALLWGKNISTSVITLEKKDPGEYLCDLPALKARLFEQQDALCFVIDQARSVALGDITHRINEIDQLVPIFMNIARPLVRRQYVAYLAKQLHEDPSLLWAEISGRLKNRKESQKELLEVHPARVVFNSTEKLLAQIIACHPELSGELSESLLMFISDELKDFFANRCPTDSPIAHAIRAEREQAPEISLEEAQALLKALDQKLVRIATQKKLKQKRQELQAAEKANDFSLVLKSLKEQTQLLAQNKRVKPMPVLTPEPVTQVKAPQIRPAEFSQATEEEDWL